MMVYEKELTDDQIIIRFDRSSTSDEEVQSFLDYMRYCYLGRKSKATQADVDKLVAETKGRWWEQNRERFRGIPEFERFFK